MERNNQVGKKWSNFFVSFLNLEISIKMDHFDEIDQGLITFVTFWCFVSCNFYFEDLKVGLVYAADLVHVFE